MLVATLILILLVATATAFSFGAGGCFMGQAAVASLHLRQKKITSGSLEQGHLVVLLDGQPLSVTEPNILDIHTNYNLTLATTSSSGGYFRGFLIRLGDPDIILNPADLDVPGDAATTVNSNSHTGSSSNSFVSSIHPVDLMETQLAGSCLYHNLSGISHTTNSKKSRVYSILNTPQAASNLQLDVTVVVLNRNHKSEFYYSGFIMNFKDPNTYESYKSLWNVLALRIMFGGTIIAMIIVLGIVYRKTRQANYKFTSVKAEDEEQLDEEEEEEVAHDERGHMT